MRPDENRPTVPISVPQRTAAGATNVNARPNTNEHTANLVRGQLDQIYANDEHSTKPADEAANVQAQPPAPVNVQYSHQANDSSSVYERTHNEQQHGGVSSGPWEKYHSAWQNYYQQYYERYYLSEVYKTKQELESKTGEPSQPEEHHDDSISNDEAMYDLRNKLRENMNEKAQKVRRSRHFVPAIAALAVMLIFSFLQYNRVIFAAVDAYISPGDADANSLIIDPSTQAVVGRTKIDYPEDQR